MSLAVVFVSYNSRQTLPLALASVAGAEVVVVDNASPDGTGRWLQQTHPEVQLVALSENVGFSRAINVGVARTRADCVLLLNPDAALLPGALATLPARLRELERDFGAWAVGLGQCDTHGFMQLAWGPFPSPINEALRRSVQRRLDGPARLSGRVVARALRALVPRPRRVAWVAGSSLLLRREAFYRVGGFDPGYFLYFEDIDFCLRLAAAGGHVVFDPVVRVRHLRGHSMAQAPTVARRAYRTSQRRLASQHLGPVAARLTQAWADWRARGELGQPPKW